MLLSTCLWLVIIVTVSAESFKEKVEAATVKTDEILKKLFERWDIKNYPNFLRSVAMSHTSWEVLKIKFQAKILAAASGSSEKFVISFMGSSVTAGHDSPFNVSFPILTGVFMEPAFTAVGIRLETRNSAMGNNPCLPYDVCIKPFAGADADIVHWEQMFNCGGDDNNKRVVFEQFIRQSLALPNQPVVVFSDSVTPNWKEEDCKDAKDATISDEEKKMLELISTDPLKVVSELNSNEDSARPWRAMLEMFRSYKMAGIQMWQHVHYQSYKCRGPYVKDWGCCSASWHPSLLGHELRAAHHAYFWLLIFRDALKELADVSDISHKLASVKKHIEHEHKYIPTAQIHSSDFSDSMQCYTTFEPLYDEASSLFKLVVPSGDGKEPFKGAIIEDFVDKNIVLKAKERGYKDYKKMIYGTKDSSPLSLKIHVSKLGTAFICSPPGNWGQHPDGFEDFWKVGAKTYLTENVGDGAGFVFSPEKAKELKYINRNPKDTQTVCVDFEQKFPEGNHVLTIVATTEKRIMISYLLVP